MSNPNWESFTDGENLFHTLKTEIPGLKIYVQEDYMYTLNGEGQFGMPFATVDSEDEFGGGYISHLSQEYSTLDEAKVAAEEAALRALERTLVFVGSY